MSNDPSNFFMIDGPLAPQGNVESHIFKLRRRRESVTASEILAKIKEVAERPAGEGNFSWLEYGQAVDIIEGCLDEICGKEGK